MGQELSTGDATAAEAEAEAPSPKPRSSDIFGLDAATSVRTRADSNASNTDVAGHLLAQVQQLVMRVEMSEDALSTTWRRSLRSIM